MLSLRLRDLSTDIALPAVRAGHAIEMLGSPLRLHVVRDGPFHQRDLDSGAGRFRPEVAPREHGVDRVLRFSARWKYLDLLRWATAYGSCSPAAAANG
jgi:hypothetical protein